MVWWEREAGDDAFGVVADGDVCERIESGLLGSFYADFFLVVERGKMVVMM